MIVSGRRRVVLVMLVLLLWCEYKTFGVAGSCMELASECGMTVGK